MTQAEFRKKHLPDAPPYIGVHIREGDAYCLTQGIVPDSIRQLCAEALRVFWPTTTADAATVPKARVRKR